MEFIVFFNWFCSASALRPVSPTLLGGWFRGRRARRRDSLAQSLNNLLLCIIVLLAHNCKTLTSIFTLLHVAITDLITLLSSCIQLTKNTFEVRVSSRVKLIRCSCYYCRIIVSSLRKMHWVEHIQAIECHQAQHMSMVYNDNTYVSCCWQR